MALKKAELAEHQTRYHSKMKASRTAEKRGLYSNAVKLALDSWDYIDGMMRYEGRWEEKEFTSIPSIDIVLKYSPMLMDFDSLNRLEELLKSHRRIEKQTSHSLGDKLSKARELLSGAHRLWEHLENNPETRQDELGKTLGGAQKQWKSLVDTWWKMGLVVRTPPKGRCVLALSTRMGGLVSGKCSLCGHVAEAPKGAFLDKLPCPECGKEAMFVILVTENMSQIEE